MAMVFLASPLKEMTRLLAERPPQKSVVKSEGRTRTALCLCFLFPDAHAADVRGREALVH